MPQDPLKQRMWVMSWDRKNCYFHACDMGCLHQLQELQNVDIPQVYMDNVNFRALKPENIRVLERKNHMEAILETHEKLAQDGHL